MEIYKKGYLDPLDTPRHAYSLAEDMTAQESTIETFRYLESRSSYSQLSTL